MLVAAMGRSYGELDILFENHVPAWRFSKSKVDRESPFRPSILSLLISICSFSYAEFGLPDTAPSPADEKVSHDSKQE
jgi:hypothetical protein